VAELARPLGTSSHSRALAPDERRELQRLLAAIAPGTDCHDQRIVAFCDTWREYHVVNKGHYEIFNFRCTGGAPAALLESLRAALNDPTLSVQAKVSCECIRCDDLRGGR
jgi:hypothetical protein